MSKNTRNRILLTAVAALLLVTMAVGGTIAWLQDVTTPVVNTFSTTNVDIKLTETERTYEMVPGADIAKDPKVTVIKNSEACWLFVKVEELNNTYGDANTKILTFDPTAEKYGWTIVPGETNVWYKQVAKNDEENQEFLFFETVHVDSGVTNEIMDDHEGATNQPKLTITAYAIQSENLTTTTGTAITKAEDAWALVENATVAYNTPENATEGTLYVDAK